MSFGKKVKEKIKGLFDKIKEKAYDFSCWFRTTKRDVHNWFVAHKQGIKIGFRCFAIGWIFSSILNTRWIVAIFNKEVPN